MAEALALRGPWVRPEDDGFLWECLGLISSVEYAGRIAHGLVAVQSEWAERSVGATLDTGIFGRGLLHAALASGVRAGILESHEDLRFYQRLLDLGGLGEVPILIAYMDYLGTSDEVDPMSMERQFESVGRHMREDLQGAASECYFWRSSDTYYAFLRLGDDLASDVGGFISALVEVQENVRLDETHQGWHWQIGVNTARAQCIGDIVLPAKGTYLAAKLMQRAKSPNKGGGLILCSHAVLDGTGADSLEDLLRGRGSGKYRVERFLEDGIHQIGEAGSRGDHQRSGGC